MSARMPPNLRDQFASALEREIRPLVTDDCLLTLIMRKPDDDDCYLVISEDSSDQIEAVVRRAYGDPSRDARPEGAR